MSFNLDDEEEQEDGGDEIDMLTKSKFKSSKPLKKAIGKDPNASTSFLPDRDRDLLLEKKRKELQEEWLKEQNIIN